MSNRSGPSGERTAWLAKWDPIPKLAFAGVLAFMVGGLIGSATTTASLDPSLDLLLVNGRNYAVLLLTLLTVAVGYGAGQVIGDRR